MLISQKYTASRGIYALGIAVSHTSFTNLELFPILLDNTSSLFSTLATPASSQSPSSHLHVRCLPSACWQRLITDSMRRACGVHSIRHCNCHSTCHCMHMFTQECVRTTHMCSCMLPVKSEEVWRHHVITVLALCDSKSKNLHSKCSGVLLEEGLEVILL